MNDVANASGLYLLAAGGVAAFPSALVEAGLMSLVWRLTRPDIVTKWLLALLGAAAVAIFRSSAAMAWPWRAAIGKWDRELASDLTARASCTPFP